MRINIISSLLIILLTLGLVTGCTGVKVVGSGNLVTKTLEYSNFIEVKVENGIQVELIQSCTFNVEITADDNVMEYIEVSKSGNTLRIKPKSNTAFRSATMIVRLTMPNLNKLELSGGSGAEINGFYPSDGLSVRLSGGSQISNLITSGNVTVANANFDLSGGSHVRLTGSADGGISVDCSGGSHIDLEGFSVNNADIKLSGGSHATINVVGTLNVDISGGSEVIYIGDPTMGDIDVAWDSDLVKQ
ncbi:head GIN domain-containing protein [Chloroflexota bacterium]